MDVPTIEGCIRRCLLVARNRNEDLIIVHGGARGADSICDQVCREVGVRRLIVNAEWRRYGRQAGYLRNQQMLDEHNDVEKVFAFIVSDSPGSRDMIVRARRKGIAVHVTRG